jgi:hypothetical protein
MRIVLAFLAGCAGLALATAAVQSQSVHRCMVDGRIVFSDRPCEDPAPAPAAVPPSAPRAPAASADELAVPVPAPAWKEIVRREIVIGSGAMGTEVTFECADKRRGRALADGKPKGSWVLRDGTRHASIEAAAGSFCSSQ